MPSSGAAQSPRTRSGSSACSMSLEDRTATRLKLLYREPAHVPIRRARLDAMLSVSHQATLITFNP